MSQSNPGDNAQNSGNGEDPFNEEGGPPVFSHKTEEAARKTADELGGETNIRQKKFNGEVRFVVEEVVEEKRFSGGKMTVRRDDK